MKAVFEANDICRHRDRPLHEVKNNKVTRALFRSQRLTRVQTDGPASDVGYIRELLRRTCESNTLLLFWRLAFSPSNLLLEPRGLWKYTSPLTYSAKTHKAKKVNKIRLFMFFGGDYSTTIKSSLLTAGYASWYMLITSINCFDCLHDDIVSIQSGIKTAVSPDWLNSIQDLISFKHKSKTDIF